MKDRDQIEAIMKAAAGMGRQKLRGHLRKYATAVQAAIGMTPKQLVRGMNSFDPDKSIKAAELGGEQDQGFEQSFASLAYTYVADKAPGLLDHLIGFQLVDRNEKDTKAVGVFGFKVGPQWLYVPVFFLGGDIKGHELLFLKSQQMFVPLKENWVNYLINKRPQQLGEGVPQNSQEMGVLQPNLQNAVRSAGGLKFSSLRQRPWARETGVIEAMVRESGRLDTVKRAAAFFGNEYPSNSPLDLGKLLATSPSLTEATVNLCEAWPGVKVAMDVHYGKDFLANLIRGHIKTAEKRAAAEEEAPPPVLRVDRRIPFNQSRKKKTSILKGAASDDPEAMPVSKVEIITENLPTLSEEERSKLLRDGKLIKDHRDGEEKTVAYDTTTPMALCNPDITGVYDVLIGKGEFEKCLVVFAPYDGNKRRRYVTIVRLDGERNWLNVHPSRVFIRQAGKPDTREKEDWFKDLPGSEGAPEQNGTYVAVSVSGEGTVPFKMGADLEDGLHEAVFMDEGNEDADSKSPGYPGICCSPYGPGTLQFNQRKGTSFLTQNGNTYVPEKAKVIKISEPPKCAKCSKPEVDCTCDYFRYDRFGKNKLKPIILGNLSDLQLAMRHKTAELKITEDSCEFVINSKRMPKTAGVVHLVRDHGLDEGHARQLLKEAERYSGIRLRVKYANGYPMMGGFPAPTGGGDGGYMGPSNQYVDPYASADMMYGGQGANMVEPLRVEEQVPGLQAGMTDPNIYNPMANMDPMAMQMAQQASQSGQKEVFDTAMFNSLTRSIRPDSMVDGDLGNIAETVNILGRMLFLFYWHNEEFQERYGKKDLPELSDTLRNAFEMLGDLLLYLKQKSVDTVFGTDLRSASPDIGDASGN
jgi:hypothetical protein